jgi:murein DD-endopeptidase MepM/ murein hydrolase activator NlpD
VTGNGNKYYRSGEDLQLHELRWVRTKLAAVIGGSAVVCILAILLVNHLAHDPIGIGYDRVNVLTRENRELQQKLTALTSRMTALNTAVGKINEQGNELRLMVDLQPISESVSEGGIGGAVPQPDLNVAGDQTSHMLESAIGTLEKLNGEVRVQEQSYEEIDKKYSFNKGYFAALPALKPASGYYSPSGFGLRMHPILGIFRTHQGLDIITDVGTPVYASGNGTVRMAGQSGNGYGIAIAIDHGYGYQTLYAHLSKVLVREGQHVRRGDLIGKTGKSGLVSGPHLHYEVRLNGVCKNPMDYFFDDVTADQIHDALASASGGARP